MNIHRVGNVDLINLSVTLASGANAIGIVQGAPIAYVASKAVPASQFTWTTDEATTRTNFAAAFCGISESRARLGSVEPRDQSVEVNMDGSYEFDVATGTALAVGDYLGCAKAAGNALLDTVKKVTVRTEAIAICVETMTSTGTRVRARLINTLRLK